jgi:hypothetical protein
VVYWLLVVSAALAGLPVIHLATVSGKRAACGGHRIARRRERGVAKVPLLWSWYDNSNVQIAPWHLPMNWVMVLWGLAQCISGIAGWHLGVYRFLYGTTNPWIPTSHALWMFSLVLQLACQHAFFALGWIMVAILLIGSALVACTSAAVMTGLFLSDWMSMACLIPTSLWLVYLSSLWIYTAVYTRPPGKTVDNVMGTWSSS